MSGRRFSEWRVGLYLLALWILVWSFARSLRHVLKPIGDGSIVFTTGWLLPIAVGTLAAVWLAAGFIVFFWGHRLALSVVFPSKQSRAFRWSLRLVPGLLWMAAYLLHRAAAASDISAGEGPPLVLLSCGVVLLVDLLKQAQSEAGEGSACCVGNPVGNGQPANVLGIQWTAAAKVGSALIVTAVPVLLFADSLFDSEVVVFGHDLFKLHYMFEKFVREALYAGRLPLWNPYIFSGSPALAHPQYLVFYPPQMLLRLLPLNLSISWAVALHLWIAGIGMLVLTRRLRLKPWIAVTCALAYMLNSGLLLRVHAGHVWLLYALSWFPLVWVLIMSSLETGRPISVIGAVVGTSLILLTGHPTYPLYIVMFFALYWLFVCYGLWRKGAAHKEVGAVTLRFSTIVVAALGLSAIQLVPSIVVAGQVSVGEGYDPGQVNFLALSVTDVVAAFIPRLYQDFYKLAYYWEVVPYLGILPLLLLPLAFAGKSRDPLAHFLGWVVILSVVISFGDSAGVFSMLEAGIPGFSMARIPPRALCISIPAVVVLGGLALEAVSTRSVDTRLVTGGARVYATFSLLVLGSALAQWLSLNNRLAETLSAQELVSLQLLIVSLALALFPTLCLMPISGPKGPIRKLLILVVAPLLGFLVGSLFVTALPIAGNLLVLGLLTGADTLLIAYLHRYDSAAVVVLALIALFCFDVGAFSVPHIYAENAPSFYQNQGVVLKHADFGSHGRVMSLIGDRNQYMLGAVSNIDGYNTGVLDAYQTFLRSVSSNEHEDTTQILTERSSVDLRALNFLGVEYIVAPERLDDNRLELTSSQDDHYLYHNPGALPRAFMVYDVQVADTVGAALERLTSNGFDYARSVVVEHEPRLEPKRGGEGHVSVGEQTPTSGDLTITVWTSEPGVLVMSEPYYPERRVWVDEEETELLRANVAFSAVSLPAGFHEVELRYVPSSLYLGAAITALTILACLWAILRSGISSWARIRHAHRDRWPSAPFAS